MFELAQQLSYYASYVDGGTTSALVSLAQRLGAVASIATTAQSSLAAITEPLNAVGAAWSTREQQINNISRSLRQYQYVGQSIADINADISRSMPGASEADRAQRFTQVYNDQFQQARHTTRAVLSDINQLAARLPGESADYIQTLNQSLPFLSQRRGGMQLSEATHLSSFLAAGGIAGGIDAQQTSRDLMQFLTTGPHMVDRSWTEVWSQYATYRGRRVGAEQIRGMDINKKIEVLQNIASQLEPMMNATGDSYEATIGTLNSFKHEMFLTTTEPIFDAWKNLLTTVNGYLAMYGASLSYIGRFMATYVATALNNFRVMLDKGMAVLGYYKDTIISTALTWYNTAEDIYDYFQTLLKPLTDFVSSMYDRVSAVLGNGSTWSTLGLVVSRGILVALGYSFGPIGAVVALIIGRSFIENAGTYMSAITETLRVVAVPFLALAGVVLRFYSTMFDIVTLITTTVLPPLIELIGGVASLVLSGLTAAAYIFTNTIAMLLIPVVAVVIPAFQIVGSVIDIFVTSLRVIMEMFTSFGAPATDFVTILRQVADALKAFGVSIREGTAGFLHDYHFITDAEYQQRMAAIHGGTQHETPQWVNNLEKFKADMVKLVAGVDATGNGPPNRPHTTNDFRYSRFDITQAFAEGFSPDRVASAFVSDLESMAEQRLSSGFAPAYTLP